MITGNNQPQLQPLKDLIPYCENKLTSDNNHPPLKQVLPSGSLFQKLPRKDHHLTRSSSNPNKGKGHIIYQMKEVKNSWTW